MKFYSLFNIFAAALLLLSCTQQPVKRFTSAARPENITIVATTDFHGELEGVEGLTGDNKKIVIGGAPYFASYIRILKENVGNPVVWIDAGDLFQGSLASNRFEGAPVVKLMNHLGLDAAALGNHEFDYGPAGEKAVPRSPSDDPRGALKARIKQARYPTLAANLFTTDGKIPDWLKASTVIERFGVRIGVVGGASPGTAGTTNALNLTGLVFKPLLPFVQKEAERLRKEERVDLVVLTVHDGGACNENESGKQDDVSSCENKEILELAEKLPEGLVNVVVAGHTHRGVAKRAKNGTVVMQPFSHGKYVGWVNVNVASGKAEVGGLVPVCEKVLDTPKGKTCDPFQLKFAKGEPMQPEFFGKKITADRTVIDLLEPDLKKVRELKESPLGFVSHDSLNRDFKNESSLGNLMADISKEAYKEADVGLANGGGLRANINPGPVSYGDIFGVLPFDNQLAVMKVTGQQLWDLAAVGVGGTVGAYSWSSNITLTADKCELKELLLNGQPVDKKKIYKVATSDFLAGGGSGVKTVNIPKENIEIFWDANFILRELTVEVLKRWKKDLRASDYFRTDMPRQKTLGRCERNG